MNKAEIIRKISKEAGVPDTEAKKSFEIFLKHASELLQPGESLKIPEIGLFQLRVGQIENRTTRQSGDKFLYSDLIVFINEEDTDDKGEKEIIFNVPSGVEEEYQPVDSYFSLSIGKPVIPLKGVTESEFFIPPSGTELRNLLESKIERLIEEAEKIQGGKETESIHLQTGQGMEEPGAEYEPKSEETKVPSRSDFVKTREFENLSWDFGENLSQELEEESILDLENGQEQPTPEIPEPVQEDESVPEQPKEKEALFEEELTEDKDSDEDIFEEIIDEEAEEENIYEDFEEAISEKEPEKPAEEPEAETEDRDSRVLSTEEEDKDIHGDEEEQKTKSPEAGPEEPSLKNFQRVRSLTKEFNTTEFDDIEEIEEEKPRKITEVRGGYQKVRRTTAEFDFDLSGIKGLDEIDEESEKESSVSSREYRGYRKRSNIPSLIIALVVVLALSAVIYLYMKMKNDNDGQAGGNTTAITKQEPKIIDRDYEVPVTYPYNKAGQKATPDSSASAKSKPENKQDDLKTTPPAEKPGESLPEIREPVNAKRIGSYIYQYPEGVVVQVSSWKSRSIALSQVRKYRNAGYTAFAETSTIPDRGLYYRVRVGYFKSLSEAKSFLNGK